MKKNQRISVFRTVHFKGADIVRFDGEVIVAREDIKVPARRLPQTPRPA